MFSRYTPIKMREYPGIVFYPFHQLKKNNGGIEPYIKSIAVGNYIFDFFKIDGVVYAIKPTDKNDLTKVLCAKVENFLMIESAIGSITGNCARGIKEQFLRYSRQLDKEKLNQQECFAKLVKKNH